MTCAALLVAANAAVIGARLTDVSDADADPDVVVVDDMPDETVLIVAPDGSTISADPSTEAGKRAITDAEARGDTIIATPPGASRSASDRPSSPAAAARQSASDLDAADGVVDGLVQVLDQRTGELIQRTVQQVEDAINLPVTLPSLPTLPTVPEVDDDEPLVSVTTPGVEITTPGVSVTTPPVSVATPVTTVVVPTTTVTVPTTTVTVPTTTVTVTTTTAAPITTTTVNVTTTTVDLGLGL